MDKGEKGSDDDQDTRPRRPRRPRREDSKAEDNEQERPVAERKLPEQSQAPQAKPRRRRAAEEEDQGDGGWMGGAPDVKQKFEAEPEAVDVMAKYALCHNYYFISKIHLMPGKIRTSTSTKMYQVD
jgi:hypothetical protein